MKGIESLQAPSLDMNHPAGLPLNMSVYFMKAGGDFRIKDGYDYLGCPVGIPDLQTRATRVLFTHLPTSIYVVDMSASEGPTAVCVFTLKLHGINEAWPSLNYGKSCEAP
jgi:hypothetical protein